MQIILFYEGNSTRAHPPLNYKNNPAPECRNFKKFFLFELYYYISCIISVMLIELYYLLFVFFSGSQWDDMQICSQNLLVFFLWINFKLKKWWILRLEETTPLLSPLEHGEFLAVYFWKWLKWIGISKLNLRCFSQNASHNATRNC